MTPEEVFEPLRDVHVPEVDAPSIGGLDPRPLVIFAVVVAVIWLVRMIARRRVAISRLKMDPKSSSSERRDQIIRAMNQQVKRRAVPTIPKAAFTEPARVTEDDVRDLRVWALRRMR